MRELGETMRARLSGLGEPALPLGDRTPELVDHRRRVACDLVLPPLEMLGPQTEACRARQSRVAGDDVHLGVVEQ